MAGRDIWHDMRTDLLIKVFFYEENINEEEKELAEKMAGEEAENLPSGKARDPLV
jgi:hypothetical protein